MKYFAYGSNMDLTQMKDRCPRNHKLIGPGTLKGWEFFINSRGVANIIMDESQKVYGLLFDITENCLECLDKKEGYPEFYQRDKLPINFKRKEHDAWTYIDKNFIQVGPPRTNYLETIVGAAKKHNLPESYIEHLKTFHYIRKDK